MKKLIVILIVIVLFLIGCCLMEMKMTYKDSDTEIISIERLPHAVVGKPYYAEITIAGLKQRAFFEAKDNGLNWKNTDVYRNPKAQVTSDSISIYGIPNKKGEIIIYAAADRGDRGFYKPILRPVYKQYHIIVLEEEPSYE